MVQKQALKHLDRGSQGRPQQKTKAHASAKKTVSQSKGTQSGESADTLTTSDQQRLLQIFSDTFQDVLSTPSFTSALQEVKQALFERAFDRAFEKEEYLQVYAARWSPTRALCYASVLCGIEDDLARIAGSPATASPSSGVMAQGDHPEKEDENGGKSGNAEALKILAIGGGAAEIVAVGFFLSKISKKFTAIRLDATLLDSGPWGKVVSMLEKGLTTPPPLSKYASAAIRAANVPMVSAGALSYRFVREDALAMDKAQLLDLSGAESGRPCLVTLLFTLNELFATGGLGSTTTFLLNLTAVVPPGSLLLVVDSPGSYSETSVGSQAKKYPMQWLLERILLGRNDEDRTWTKLQSHDSVWFRLAAGLRYPITLEDMRYQMHLYKLEVTN